MSGYAFHVVLEEARRAAEKLLMEAGKISKRRALAPIERRLERAMGRAFKVQGAAFGKAFRANQDGRKLFSEADDPLGWMEPMFAKSEADSLKFFMEPLEAAVTEALMDGALAVLGGLEADYSFTLKNPRAVAYAQAHGVDLVAQIHETTKSDMRYIVSYGLENGWSYNKTARAIQAKFQGYYDPGSWWNFDAERAQGHIDSRAHLIAVTEAGNAYEAGNFVVVEDLAQAGMAMEKQWSTMGDDKVSEGCKENAAEGWIAAAQAHQSGDMHPLRFPGCRCDEFYRVKSGGGAG